MNALDQIIQFQRKQEDDYYYILGCDQNSTEEQITAEYKARVLSCHPDKHQCDPYAKEKFSKLSQAKDTLLDSEKRKEYNKWRNSGVAIPYDTWRSMSQVHTSLHWGYQKEQLSISQLDQPASLHSSKNRFMSSQTEKSESQIELEDRMKFTLREPSKNNSGINWERDRSNPTLEKFRKYQI
ncbi:hypothetical protein Btru_004976 [Bulinus truncatus]|nr:hypothetical protein Btru_004976 [Bulinus truncatus]